MKGVEIIPVNSSRAIEMLEESIRQGHRMLRRKYPPSSEPHIRPKIAA